MSIFGEAKLKIVEPGFLVNEHNVLREKTRDVTPAELEDPAFKSLIDLMVATMRDGGVGLAAPQVGIPLRVAVVEDPQEAVDRWPTSWIERFERRPFKLQVLINPRLTVTSDRQIEAHEACLSVPGIWGAVSRAHSCRVDAIDLEGQPVQLDATGWQARVYQHECDHLDGEICVGKFHPGTFLTAVEYTLLRDAEKQNDSQKQ